MLYSVMAKKLSGSDQSRDDKESKLDVGNPNHNNAPPSEITVEFEADSNVYYKETMVDSYNTITPPIIDSILLFIQDSPSFTTQFFEDL